MVGQLYEAMDDFVSLFYQSHLKRFISPFLSTEIALFVAITQTQQKNNSKTEQTPHCVLNRSNENANNISDRLILEHMVICDLEQFFFSKLKKKIRFDSSH